jgi:hypothetical protein
MREARLRKVVVDISMSLDGIMTAADRRSEQPMGTGGQRPRVGA